MHRSLIFLYLLLLPQEICVYLAAAEPSSRPPGITTESAATTAIFDMNDGQLAWLRTNRTRLLDSQMPIDNILDELVAKHVFYTNHDDYQIISVQPTISTKTRRLLNALPSKSPASFKVFVETLEKFCPHVVERCTAMPRPPKTRMGQLHEQLSAVYTSRKHAIMPAMAWLGATGEVRVETFFRDLVVVDRETLAAESMTDRASTTTAEQRRREERFARPARQRTIPFSSVFQSFTPLRNTALWAGAGCGKSGTCSLVAQLHAKGEMWTFFSVLLLWRLRDPRVQRSTSLEQLLQVLLPDSTQSKRQEFAEELFALNGRGVLAILDGVDELIEHEDAFVVRLLKGEVLIEARILITSRPCAAARTYCDSSVFDAHLELLGFSEEQVDAFIDERLGDQLGSKLKELLNSNPAVASLMSVPLLALFVCQVFKATPNLSLPTKTRLYSFLAVLVLRHAVDERRVSVSGTVRDLLMSVRHIDQLPGSTKELLMHLAKIAWTAHQSDKAIFDVEFIVNQAKCDRYSDSLKLGLLDSQYVKDDDLHASQHFSFQHLTIQEFLAAYFIAEKISHEHERLRLSWRPSFLQRRPVLESTLAGLCKDTHSFVVFQFLAGLLKREHHPSFFSLLNKWLHNPPRSMPRAIHPRSKVQIHPRHVALMQTHRRRMHRVPIQPRRSMQNHRRRLRVCLQCAQEACGGDVGYFPEQLKLPDVVVLYRVTAADLTLLTSSIKTSSSIKELVLDFDQGAESELQKFSQGSRRQSRHNRLTGSACWPIHDELVSDLCQDIDWEESDSEKWSRNHRQTRSALASLISAISQNISLSHFTLSGPSCEAYILEKKALANLVSNHHLKLLRLRTCGIENTQLRDLSPKLAKKTKLSVLDLSGNMISDAGLLALGDALAHNTTLRTLWLADNRFGEDAVELLKRKLTHVQNIHTYRLAPWQ